MPAMLLAVIYFLKTGMVWYNGLFYHWLWWYQSGTRDKPQHASGEYYQGLWHL